MWSYNQLSRHQFLEPPTGARSIGRDRFFLDDNPRIFFLPQQCPYCHSACQVLGEKDEWQHTDGPMQMDSFNIIAQLYVCQACGWWTVPVRRYHDDRFDEHISLGAGQVRGELKRFSREADGVPIGELHRYLLAHYAKRNVLSPYRVEDAVAQIFRDAGHQVVATARSNDGGIDLFITQNDNAEPTAVQIKRTRNKIGVELIRSFAGALLGAGLTRGVFVTTSDYTINARQTAERFAHDRGYAIELVESEALFDALKIHRRDTYTTADEASAPFAEVWREPGRFVTTGLGGMDRIQI